jgi:hypothetical protein
MARQHRAALGAQGSPEPSQGPPAPGRPRVCVCVCVCMCVCVCVCACRGPRCPSPGLACSSGSGTARMEASSATAMRALLATNTPYRMDSSGSAASPASELLLLTNPWRTDFAPKQWLIYAPVSVLFGQTADPPISSPPPPAGCSAHLERRDGEAVRERHRHLRGGPAAAVGRAVVGRGGRGRTALPWRTNARAARGFSRVPLKPRCTAEKDGALLVALAPGPSPLPSPPLPPPSPDDATGRGGRGAGSQPSAGPTSSPVLAAVHPDLTAPAAPSRLSFRPGPAVYIHTLHLSKPRSRRPCRCPLTCACCPPFCPPSHGRLPHRAVQVSSPRTAPLCCPVLAACTGRHVLCALHTLVEQPHSPTPGSAFLAFTWRFPAPLHGVSGLWVNLVVLLHACMRDDRSTGLRLLLWSLPGADSSFPPLPLAEPLPSLAPSPPPGKPGPCAAAPAAPRAAGRARGCPARAAHAHTRARAHPHAPALTRPGSNPARTRTHTHTHTHTHIHTHTHAGEGVEPACTREFPVGAVCGLCVRHGEAVRHRPAVVVWTHYATFPAQPPSSPPPGRQASRRLPRCWAAPPS